MDAPIEAKADRQKFEYLTLRFYKEEMTDSQSNWDLGWMTKKLLISKVRLQNIMQ
jgi:hypothetical protein